MKSLNKIRSGAAAVVKDASGPLGARPIQRVICDHLIFFEELRADGASWEQIAALLESEGLRSRKGGVVSAGVLRALCSRAAKMVASPRIHQDHASIISCDLGSDATKQTVRTPSSSLAVHNESANRSLSEAIARAARLRGVTEETD